MTRPDAVVVGAGIVGAACARALAADGRHVLVVDGGTIGGGTTGAGMGHLVAMDDSPAQLALTAYGLRLWDEILPSLIGLVEYRRTGTLWLATEPAQVDAAAPRLATLRAAGIAAELLDAHALYEAEPDLRPGLAGAMRVAGDGVLYPPGAAAALLRFDGRGTIRRRLEKVDAIVRRGVIIGHERIEAEIVVNAAGALAPTLTPGLAIVPRKGHLAITDRQRPLCRHQLVELDYLASAHAMNAASVAFNLQPRATGQLLIGSSRELVGWTAGITPAVLSAMLARAVSYVPALAQSTIVRVWTGFRPATADSLPLVGAWPATPGVFVAAGHEGLGITTALATAAMIADLAAGRPTAIDAAPYAPDRVMQAHAA